MKVLVMLLGLLPGTLLAQTLDYKIIWRGDSVGYIHATQADSLGYRVVSIESVASIWFFGDRRIETTFHSVFDGERLDHSEVMMYRNGNLKEKTRTFWLRDHYEVIIDDEVQATIQTPITQTVASLYFTMPDVGPVYSERLGIEMPFLQAGEEYTLEKPGGHLNTYSFGKKHCNLVEVDNSLTKLYIVRVNASD